MEAVLALEDGTIVEGTGFGIEGVAEGELVFNTSMTGYTESLTDPSYAGQILMMTYPLIGNYGVTSEDYESDKIQVARALSLKGKGITVKAIQDYHKKFRDGNSTRLLLN